ncbi:MAG: SAM-dependent methyltransferase [Pseudomonadota bacterium]
MSELPAPPAVALALSEELTARIHAEIHAAGGSIPFSRYMELCLYSPGLGYYSAGLQKFGEAGDFVTAPEISPLFGQCLAQSCAAVLAELGGGDLLEFGAGSGRLAVDVLSALAQLQQLPGTCYIIERSADLRERQQVLLAGTLPDVADRVRWLDALPAGDFRGVILANEVLDAMPVERFHWTGAAVEQYCVADINEAFGWQLCKDTPVELATAVAGICEDNSLPSGYVAEANLMLAPWLQGVATAMSQGVVLLADYGYPRHEYYHVQRTQGTLMCHYRHRVHDDPFLWPGLQDITAHVDFTAVAEAAVAAGFAVSGYTTQAHFLLDCGLEQLLQAQGEPQSTSYLRAAQQVKTLIMPGEMGERFKFIALTKDVELEIPGFRMQNMRGRL